LLTLSPSASITSYFTNRTSSRASATSSISSLPSFPKRGILVSIDMYSVTRDAGFALRIAPRLDCVSCQTVLFRDACTVCVLAIPGRSPISPKLWPFRSLAWSCPCSQTSKIPSWMM